MYTYIQAGVSMILSFIERHYRGRDVGMLYSSSICSCLIACCFVVARYRLPSV